MDFIKSDDVIRIIEQSSYHFHLNIANRVLRPFILQLNLDAETWKYLETYTENLEMYRYSGYELGELYRQIAACARFVKSLRDGFLSIKNQIISNKNAPDKVYRDMTVNNLPNNVKIFADFLNELYSLLVDIENECGNRPPVHTQIPELENLSLYLNE